MKRWFKILFSLNSLRKALGWQLFFRSTKFDHHLEVVERLVFKNTLILAPHPDDDVFGLGGVMRKLAQNGSNVTVIYFCDGGSGGKLGARYDTDLAKIRQEEAKRSGQILGTKEQIFLNFHDGQLATGENTTKVLKSLIDRVKPDIIFVPSFLDNHPDHRVVNEILVNIIVQGEKKAVYPERAKRVEWEIWAYEVWTPLYANRIVMVNDALPSKKEAIHAHRSQLMFRSYDKAILGLNEYRAQINGQSGFAEAFFATSPENYKKLYQES